jgi:YggT family protein
MVEFFEVFLNILRPALFGAAGVATVFCAIDWLVRTRRIRPFSPMARFARNTIDPLLRPVERSVVRAGGQPASAPLWTLVFVVVGGIVVLSVLGFIRDQLLMASAMSASGPSGVLRLLIRWTFSVLKLALIVRVVCAWFGVSPFSRWVRWAFVVSDPMLAPLRRIVPPLGMVDITPIVAYLLLSLVQGGLTALL